MRTCPLSTEDTFRRFNATIGHCDSLASISRRFVSFGGPTQQLTPF